MLKIRKTPLALAVAGAITAAPAVNAMNVKYAWNPGTSMGPPVFAQELFHNDNVVAVLPDNLSVNIAVTDNIIGRTTGFNIQFILDSTDYGFATVLPAGAPCSSLLTQASAITPVGGTGWSCEIAGATDNAVTLSISAGAASNGVQAGSAIYIPWGTLALDNVADEAAAGDLASMSVYINDPVGGNNLLSHEGITLGTAAPGVEFSSNPAGSAFPDSRIDVGAVPTKTWFSPDGSIGNDTATGSGTYVFDAGTFGYNPAMYDRAGVTTSGAPSDWTETVECLGAVDNCTSGPGGLTFDTTADTVTITVSGSDFSAFDTATSSGSAWIQSTTQTCANWALAATTVALDVDLTNNTASIVDMPISSAWGDDWRVCFDADGDVEVAEQNLTVQVDLDFGGVTMDVSSQDMDLMPMELNGSEVDLYMVNPGSNTLAQGFMRFCHEGTVDGTVVLQGVDDAGTEAPQMTFDLTAGSCLMMNSQDLENGNPDKGLSGAFGAGAGKWRVTATGAFDGLKAAAYIRNTDSGDVYNVSNSSLDRTVVPAWAQ